MKYDCIICDYLSKKNILQDTQIQYIYDYMQEKNLSFYDAVCELGSLDEMAVLKIFKDITQLTFVQINFLNLNRERIISTKMMKENLFIPFQDIFYEKNIKFDDVLFGAQSSATSLHGEVSISLHEEGLASQTNLSSHQLTIPQSNSSNTPQNPTSATSAIQTSQQKLSLLINTKFTPTNLEKTPKIKIAIANPFNVKTLDNIKKIYNFCDIEFFLTTKSNILDIIELFEHEQQLEKNFLPPQDPIIFFRNLIFDAIEKDVSDIHIEPEESLTRIRIRIDGVLQIYSMIANDFNIRLQNRLKLISDLSLTEKRRPQSGSTRINVNDKLIDLRISTHPDICGENFVIRILNHSNGIKNIDTLGFKVKDVAWLKQKIKMPHGIFLIVGPTGVGKTTTLYSLLQTINNETINIMTLEDPVECRISGIKQLDLKEEGMLSFSDGIKSILRQDPDVLLIGEIRDEKTAASALRASLTGRLVLSTLHSPTPISALQRIKDLNIDVYEFLPQIVGIFSQRLVRMKKKNEKNYEGRFPIVEYLEINERIKKRFIENIFPAKEDLMESFVNCAKNALEDGTTDADEIERILGEKWEGEV